MKRTRLEAELNEATRQARAIMTAADNDKREMSAEERAKVQGHLDEARTLKSQIDSLHADEAMRAEIERFAQGAKQEAIKAGEAAPQRDGRRLTAGEQFVASEVYGLIKAGKHRAAGFSASLELLAATLTEDSASGGDLVLPDYRQGIVPKLQRQIRVTQLLMPGTTTSNSVEYMQETTFTNAAAARSEEGAAAESTLVFDRVAEPVRSIAHFLPVTAEMLEDQEQTQSYIDGRLSLGLELAEEDELLNGASASAPHIVGLMNRSGLNTATARGTDTNADAIFKQIMSIMTAAFIMPDGVVINPANWQTIVLSKDGNGVYYGQGPFAAMQTPVLWGLPAAVTPVITANTAFVGAFGSCAQRFVRRGATLTASNSHSDYFTKRLVAIMAEMREALAVYRPGAFGKVTGLN